MTPAQAELLSRYRRLITDMQRDMDAFQERGMSIHANGEDITEQHMQATQERIDSLRALVEKHDPEGVTTIV